MWLFSVLIIGVCILLRVYPVMLINHRMQQCLVLILHISAPIGGHLQVLCDKIYSKVATFMSTDPYCCDLLWGPPSLLFNGYRKAVSPGQGSRVLGAVSLLPHTSSWLGAYLIKHRDNFTTFSFLICLLSDALRVPCCAASNEAMINEQWMGRNVEGEGQGLIIGTSDRDVHLTVYLRVVLRVKINISTPINVFICLLPN
jgi:hypothetical protein